MAKKKNNLPPLMQVYLEQQTSPKIAEEMGTDWILYGDGVYKNMYPQFITDLYYNSSTHSAIVNATAEMIAGEDLVTDVEDTQAEAYLKLKQFMENANGNETLHEVWKKISFDIKLHGSFALNIIWSKDRTQIAEIYHVPVERLRVGKPDKLGRIVKYYISTDWGNYRRKEHQPYSVPAFNVNDRTSPSQIIYSGTYSPGMDIYYTPDYASATNWCLTDQLVAEFHLSNIKNGFSPSYFISMNNGIPSQEERLAIENQIKTKFTGASNAGKFVLSFNDDASRQPTITPVEVSNADKQYTVLNELTIQNIMIGHRVTSPMLLGVKTEGQLGGRNELLEAFDLYLNTVIIPYQKVLMKTINKILSINDINLKIDVKQTSPISTRFDLDTLKDVMTQDEIREELGLEPLAQGEETADRRFAQVGTQVADGKELPVFDTIEEAIDKAREMGCDGYHEHSQDGKTVYMPCENHEQITALNDCDCEKTDLISPNPCQPGYEPYGHKIKDGRKVPNCVPIDASELDKFLATYGEPLDDNWELVHEENSEGEKSEFDFEDAINKAVTQKIELANTGRAIPNARSEQDGISKKTYDFYRVRYIYAEDEFLARKKPGNSREFCKKMMAAKKVYRKEDIVKMSTLPVNPGWGPNGSDTYDIFRFKGGANCHHYWLRQIYRTKLDIGVSTKIEDAQIIGITKARSEGFYPKKNDARVSKAPKRMPNKGFL